MAKTRIHELAKELQISSRELIGKISSLGIPVKNHMSTLTEEEVSRVRLQFVDSSNTLVQEKRIGKRIIRRRRVKLTPPVTEAPAETDIEKQEEIPQTPVFEEAPEVISTDSTILETGTKEPPEDEVKLSQEEITEETSNVTVENKKVSIEEIPEEENATPHEDIAPETPEEKTIINKGEIDQKEKLKTSNYLDKASGIGAPPSPSSREEKNKEIKKESVPPIRLKKEKKIKKKRAKSKKKEEAAIIISLPEKIAKSKVEPRNDVENKVPINLEKLRKERKSQKTRDKIPAKEIKDEVIGPLPLPGKKIRRLERKRVVSKEDLYTRKQLKTQRISKSKKAAKTAKAEGNIQKTRITVPKTIKRRLKIYEAITVSNLAKQMGVVVADVIKKLMELGLMLNANQSIDFETAALVAEEFGFKAENSNFEEEHILQVEKDKEEDLKPRSPIVTIMGHVDHGKTSLLDVIRHTNVTRGEAGGITQHIGAYQVSLKNGDVTFLDTPGHEAFTSMRARGAQITDLVILVVAADDGIMQQTLEAINHSRAANIPILVALNKIDKPNANPEKVKRQLAEHGLIPEEWGGDTTVVEVSAKKKIGIEDLLEMILLQAEILELKANPNKPARGRIVESRLDRGRGPVATVLIQEGTLSVGDYFICGTYYGKIRALINSNGQRVSKAGPSMPVEIQGLSGVPVAGDDFAVVGNEKNGKMISEYRRRKQRESELTRTTKLTLEKLYEHMKEEETKELKLILKTDVHGSLEAISDSLKKLQTDEIKVNIIHSATGGISETDIMLASASNAIIIGFNVRADMKVMEIAERERVDVRFYEVIYKLISDVRDALEGMLEPEYKENVIGRAEVREIFNIPRIGTIAGCYVTDGKIERSSNIRVLRSDVVVYQGKINSLKRFKDDVKEVKSGYECGLGIEKFNDIKVNDIIEAFVLEEIHPTLDIEKPEHNSES